MSQSKRTSFPPTRITLPEWGSPCVMTSSPPRGRHLRDETVEGLRAGRSPPPCGHRAAPELVPRTARPPTPSPPRYRAASEVAAGREFNADGGGRWPEPSGSPRCSSASMCTTSCTRIRAARCWSKRGLAPRRDTERRRPRSAARDGRRCPVLARHRRHHEVQTALGTQDSGSVEGAPQPLEGRPSIAPQPSLLVEIVDRDEMASSDVVHREPVVTAEAFHDVLQALDIQAPACGQRVDQLMLLESRGRRSHRLQRMGDLLACVSGTETPDDRGEMPLLVGSLCPDRSGRWRRLRVRG